MGSTEEHCAFVLLAEFDIDKGAQLTYQFPQPLGTDEGLLANLMLPDGAERQLEDWTIFFLNQTPFNRIAPVLALESHSDASSGTAGADEDGPELLYVLNLVRTKHDKTVRRGAVVKAMAICTRHPFIQIFKPVLLMALDDYFSDPSQECLARLFDAVNAMDISLAPTLTRDEKLVMRVAERKDVFTEKFTAAMNGKRPSQESTLSHSSPAVHPLHPASNYVSNRDTVVMRTTENGSGSSFEDNKTRSRTDSMRSHQSASEASFTLGGSGAWTGDESDVDGDGQQSATIHNPASSHVQSQRGRRSMESNSASSHGMHSGKRDEAVVPAIMDPYSRAPKDTHFFSTSIDYRGHALPIKMPLSTFPEEVGDYSLISLIQTFSIPNTIVSGPQHPHLHTNGILTHPIILLFNALITNKRVIFLGYQRPAGQVSSVVLAACALGSGCGAVLRGFIARAFPYANLTNREEWENIPGYIAGVTNPIFESAGSWDLLCDIGNGRMVVHKDIYSSWPVASQPPLPGSLLTRAGTIKAEVSAGSEEEMGRASSQINAHGARNEHSQAGKADSSDNVFMDDIVSAISYHFGESLVRARFTEYVFRFVRLVGRYEEEYMGSTKIGYPSSSFSVAVDGYSQLGSGIIFPDDVSATKELSVNANRIEGWRRTKMYEYYSSDFQMHVATKPIQGFDIYHQLVRLKTVKNMNDQEVELIMRTLSESVQTYDQVIELLALLPQYLGGLLPVTFGLFHQQEQVRSYTVDLLTVLRAYPIGIQFLQSLNHFHRYAFVRQAHARDAKQYREQSGLLSPPMSNLTSRTPSNRSESSLGGG
ncbi:spindle pole body interacting protein [Phellopilus nigrolimitatus]|nr:spindle pole body interacting protein [Phellopilus nigrolimitatus]